MAPPSCFSTLYVCTFLVASVSTRHIHRAQVHQHQYRQAVPVTITAVETSSLTTAVTAAAAPAAASFAAGNDAIADIEKIQAGLSDLPADLLSLVQSVEARLEYIENVLQELVGSTSTSVSSTLPVSPTLLPQPSTLIRSTTATNPTTASSSLVPSLPALSSRNSSSTSRISYNTTTRTSRVTSTRIQTITVPQATSTLPASWISRGLPSGTFTNSGNWTLPLSTSGRPAVASSSSSSSSAAATRTIMLLPPAPTAWEQR